MPIRSKAQQRYIFSQAQGGSAGGGSSNPLTNPASKMTPERAQPKGTYKNKPVKGFKRKAKVMSGLSSFDDTMPTM